MRHEREAHLWSVNNAFSVTFLRKLKRWPKLQPEPTVLFQTKQIRLSGKAFATQSLSFACSFCACQSCWHLRLVLFSSDATQKCDQNTQLEKNEELLSGWQNLMSARIFLWHTLGGGVLPWTRELISVPALLLDLFPFNATVTPLIKFGFLQPEVFQSNTLTQSRRPFIRRESGLRSSDGQSIVSGSVSFAVNLCEAYTRRMHQDCSRPANELLSVLCGEFGRCSVSFSARKQHHQSERKTHPSGNANLGQITSVTRPFDLHSALECHCLFLQFSVCGWNKRGNVAGQSLSRETFVGGVRYLLLGP